MAKQLTKTEPETVATNKPRKRSKPASLSPNKQSRFVVMRSRRWLQSCVSLAVPPEC